MQRKVLAIGRKGQIDTALLQTQLIAAFQRTDLVLGREETMFSTNEPPDEKSGMAAKAFGVSHVFLIGLKGHTLESRMSAIAKAMAPKEVKFLIVLPDGVIPPFKEEFNVEIFKDLEAFSTKDFSKEGTSAFAA